METISIEELFMLIGKKEFENNRLLVRNTNLLDQIETMKQQIKALQDLIEDMKKEK